MTDDARDRRLARYRATYESAVLARERAATLADVAARQARQALDGASKAMEALERARSRASQGKP